MANAKKCDICGKYYDVPQPDGDMMWEESINTSMVRILRRKPTDHRIQHDVMQFDACEDCLQSVIDHILTKQTDRSDGA